ncbi:MAG: hypothetical protein OXU23_00285, partial [Candidatus Poribacteria bacterium]|nr:hypothetical protein [Candidatus Poribacteria bacterium]
PAAWIDTDKAQFEINLSQIARKFQHFEAVSYEKGKHIVDKQTAAIEHEIKKAFSKFNVDNNPELHIAILARISQRWIQQLDE